MVGGEVMADQIYKVKDPSGVIREIKGPAGASDAEIISQAQTLFAKAEPAPEKGMGATDVPWHENFLAGAGKAMTDLGRGGAQLFGFGPSEAEMTAIKKQDAPLMNTGAGIAGNVAGNVAATLPTLAIPGVNTYTGAGLLGAALGGAQPIAEGESRGQNALLGGAGGVAGQAVGNTLSRALQPVKSSLNPEAERLASLAVKEGIPLDAAAQTGSKPLKIMNSVFENLPFTAGPQAAKNEATQAGFNSAVLKRAGIDAATATPDVLVAQRGALGKIFEDISTRNNLHFDAPLTTKLAAIADDAAQHLPPDAEQKIAGTVDKILSQVGAKDLMSGSNYQGWRTPLYELSKKGDETASYYGKLKRALDEAFSAQITGADAQAWKEASREYGNLKTISKAMGGSGTAAQVGDIAPTQLSAALRQAVGTEGKALGRGDLNDLSRVGNLFVRDNVPNSGTAQRMLMQSLLTGGGGAGVGAIGAGVSGQDPLKGAAVGAGVAGASLATPRLIQALIQTPAAQKYMIQQATSPTAKALAIAAQNGGRSLGAAVPLIYGGQ